MRRLTILGLLFLTIILVDGVLGQTPQNNPLTTIEDALAAAKVKGKMVLVDFFSPG